MDTVPLSKAPKADLLIELPDGVLCALMFHFACEHHDIGDIAREQGFELVKIIADDEWQEKYENADNIGDFLPFWMPQGPDGFRLAGKWDTEDGPVAWFIRERDEARRPKVTECPEPDPRPE